MAAAGATSESGEAALHEAFRPLGDEPARAPEPDVGADLPDLHDSGEPADEAGDKAEDVVAPGDLMPAALEALSEANRAGTDPAAEEIPAEDVNAAAFEEQDTDSDQRHMPAEPQAGPPPYSGDETAFAEHAEEAPDHGLEPYADDEEPVVYDEESDDGQPVEATAVPQSTDQPDEIAMGDEPGEPTPAEEEDPTEIAARALAMADSPVESMRRGQMAEIRQMLDELQTDSAAPDSETDTEDETAEAEPDPIPARPYEEDEYRDPLKERLAAVSGATSDAQKRAKKVKDYDRDKLIKRHQRRYRRKKIAEAKTRPNAFAAGFMLIVMVAALMTGVYLLHPQIIARVPDAEPALLSYVQIVDGFRGVVAEKMDALRLMVEETIEKSK